MLSDKSIYLNKADYLLATACGLLAGIIDVIFVGDPSDSALGKAVDKKADELVVKAAQFFYDHDKRTIQKPGEKPANINKCISYLEQAFPVNYDARYAKDLNVSGDILKDMAPKNHHLKSLAHSPDILGLVFSIIDQFNSEGKASFIDKGKIISVKPLKESKNKYPYFYGNDDVSKLYCGFVNWLGHMISDVGGSSSSRQKGKTGRGMGIPMPFFELSLLFDSNDADGESFADVMTKVYEGGYDLRFGIASAIPVVIGELLVRCVWTLRQKFFYKKSWKDSLPSSSDENFRLMLLLSSATFTVADGADAAIRTITHEKKLGWNWVGFFSRINLVGVTRLTELLLKECLIRTKKLISGVGEDYIKSLFDKTDNANEAKFVKLAESIKRYLDYTDWRKSIEYSLQDQKEAKCERIRIEQTTLENTATIIECRENMYHLMEDCFAEYIVAFDDGFNRMDEAILSNDPDAYIDGNLKIQKQLGKDMQFHSQSEFDDLMSSDDDFRL